VDQLERALDVLRRIAQRDDLVVGLAVLARFLQRGGHASRGTQQRRGLVDQLEPVARAGRRVDPCFELVVGFVVLLDVRLERGDVRRPRSRRLPRAVRLLPVQPRGALGRVRLRHVVEDDQKVTLVMHRPLLAGPRAESVAEDLRDFPVVRDHVCHAATIMPGVMRRTGGKDPRAASG
jgi:hypothetical protein